MDPITIAMGLAQFAPSIIKWITGSDKAADAATSVVQVAQQVTGVGSGPEALAALQANAELQQKFRLAVLDQETTFDKMYLEDRQNARDRDVALAKAGVHNTRANAMVAIDAGGLVFSLFSMMMLGYVRAKYPDSLSEGVFGALLAQLSTLASYFGLCLRDAHQFEFGSSRGSQQKTELLIAKDGK